MRDYPDDGAAPEAREAVALARLETALASHPGRIALVSSFGAESVVLLHMVSRLDSGTPVLFGETGMLFPETLSYQRKIAETLGLSDIRHLHPDPADLAAEDRDGALHRRDDRACCRIRKVLPLERALAGFDAWITGRKRSQSPGRAALPFAERDGAGRLKLNPLADWSPRDIAAQMDRHALPRHPLVAKGFPSIGCAPCTTPVGPGEAPRAGRWRGKDRDECGIHFVGGRATRAADAPIDRL
ncbi:MAG: phosphoadenylyl-sulfate reductase [Paracoccaceae bacterium]